MGHKIVGEGRSQKTGKELCSANPNAPDPIGGHGEHVSFVAKNGIGAFKLLFIGHWQSGGLDRRHLGGGPKLHHDNCRKCRMDFGRTRSSRAFPLDQATSAISFRGSRQVFYGAKSSQSRLRAIGHIWVPIQHTYAFAMDQEWPCRRRHSDPIRARVALGTIVWSCVKLPLRCNPSKAFYRPLFQTRVQGNFTRSLQ